MATFGKTSSGASTTAVTDGSGDNKWASTATPSTSGAVTSMTSRFLVSAGSVNVRMFIYSDNAGNPGTLLAVTDDGNFTNTTVASNTLNFSGANLISIVGSTAYWVGIHWEDPAGGTLTHGCQG